MTVELLNQIVNFINLTITAGVFAYVVKLESRITSLETKIFFLLEYRGKTL